MISRGADSREPLSQLARQHELPDVAAQYIDLDRSGSEFEALCPFHADKNPSLTIYRRVTDGSWRFKCFGCGAHGDTIDFIRQIEGVDTAEAARRLRGEGPPPIRVARPPAVDHLQDWQPITPVPDHADSLDDPSRRGYVRAWNPKRVKRSDTGERIHSPDWWSFKPTAAWAYRDAESRLIGWVARIDFEDGKITPALTWCRHRETGEERWCLRPFPEPRPLLGLPELAARPDTQVLVVSGEKCQHVGTALLPSFVTVTWPGGDNGVSGTDWAPLFGRKVTLWMDADASGRAAGERIADALHAGGCPLIRVINTDGQPKGWDVADAVESGMDRAAVADFCRARVASWSPPTPEPQPQKTPGTEGGDTGGGRESVESTLREGREDTQGEAEHNALQTVESRISRLRADLATASDPADNLPAMYSEINVARRFAQVHEDNLRFVAEWGRWMIWDNQRWHRDRDLAVFDQSARVCCAVAESARLDQTEFTTDRQRQAAIARYGEKRTIYNITEVAKADRRIAAVPEQWDADPWLLNTPAGVINLRDGSMQAQARRAYQTKITAVSPGGACPTWERFLAEATGEDVEMQRYLQRIAGYALTGDITEQSFYFLYGPGGNGKGVFINTLTRLLGDYAQTAAADMFTERKHDSHPTELATLQGARLVCAQETEEGRRWAESRIKMLTGGDKITARFMRQDFFEYMPQFKLLIAGNHKPGLRNVDEAIKRRLHLIPFEVSPKEKDKHLTEKVWNEAPGIMQWAINGCLMWQREGLNPPQRVLAATTDYLEQQDVLGAWLDECVTKLPGFGTSRRGDLYKSFKAWAEDAGEYVLPQKRFITAMESRGHVARTLRGIPVYDGIGLKASAPSEPPGYWGDA